MLILDHISAGLLITNSSARFKNAVATSVILFSSILPDLPAFWAGGPGTIDYLVHRKFINSLLLAPLYSTIPVILTYLLVKKYVRNRFISLYLISLISYTTHIFLDLITPFGTELLYPISNKIYSLDYFHSFDPIFLLISSVLILSFILKQIRSRNYMSRKSVRIFLGLYMTYTCIIGIYKYNISRSYQSFVKQNFMDSHYLDTVPRTFWRWKGIAKSSDKYIVIVVANNKLTHKLYDINSNIPVSVKEDPHYTNFLNYARYPVTMNDDKNIIIVFNLIYSPDSYRLLYDIDDSGLVRYKDISGFDLFDVHF